MKQTLSALLLLAFFGYSQETKAQENKKEQIAKYLTDYFFLERENIHVHLNKNVFMTNEQLWFKGYVFHRKKNIPFFSTVNIYASLIDSEGKILETQLVYGNIGSFSGSFKLGSQFKSGKYYLQFYTNWMNNFSEDESTVYEIAIINEAQGSGTALAKADPSKINIAFRPEGGTLVSGIANTVGISVADCNNNPLPVSEALLVDGTGKTILKIQINKKGYGKFELPANTEGCKAIVTVDGTIFEQPLPHYQAIGIALEVNKIQDKTVVRIKTNKFTSDGFSGKSLYAVLHKDDQATVYEFSFKNGATEQIIALPATDVFEGTNTIRILDPDLNQLADRLIYKHLNTQISNNIYKTRQAGDTLFYKGKVTIPNMNLSISALPDGTKSIDESYDIYSSLLLLPYINSHKGASGNYYLANPSRTKMHELDLYLLNQENKYEWKNIKNNPPKSNNPFDMGLTLKGSLPESAGNIKSSKVKLRSYESALNEIGAIDSKREFNFNNLIIVDSSYVSFSLVKGKDQKPIALAPILTNSNRKFNKPFKPATKFYMTGQNEGDINIPGVYKNSIVLEEVTVEATQLKYAKQGGNSNLRSYKITDRDIHANQNVLNFIKMYGGFNVAESGGQVSITTRTVNSINGGQSMPILYIDNMQVLDYSILWMMQMREVDEIYMSPHAIVPSLRNFMGMIKIYRKKDVPSSYKNNDPQILIKNGFARIEGFENVNYNSTSDKGFENFGVIGWQPLLMTDENGNFDFTLPKTGQKTIKIIIEGFSADGRLISEIKTLAVP